MRSFGCALFGFHFPRGYLCEYAVGARCDVGRVARASRSYPLGVLLGALLCVRFRTLPTQYWPGGVRDCSRMMGGRVVRLVLEHLFT